MGHVARACGDTTDTISSMEVIKPKSSGKPS